MKSHLDIHKEFIEGNKRLLKGNKRLLGRNKCWEIFYYPRINFLSLLKKIKNLWKGKEDEISSEHRYLQWIYKKVINVLLRAINVFEKYFITS